MNNERVDYFDSIKGFACMCIFIGHFNYGFYAATNRLHSIDIFTIMLHSTIFSLFFNGTFAVSVFCIISGYFVSSSISTVIGTFAALVKRYFRFAVPLFFTCLIVYAVGNTFTFNSSKETSLLLQNNWLANVTCSKFTMKNVLEASLYRILVRGDTSYGSHLWTLRPMLIGYFLAIIAFFFRSNFSNKMLLIFIYSLLCVISAYFNYPCFAVLLGAFLKKVEKTVPFLPSSIVYSCFFASWGLCLLGVYPEAEYRIWRFTLQFGKLSQSMYALLFILAIMRSKLIQNQLSKKPLVALGRLSFPIYLLHIPVICSYSCFAFINISQNHSYQASYLLTEISTIILVLLVAILFNFAIENIINSLIDRVSFGLDFVLNMHRKSLG